MTRLCYTDIINVTVKNFNYTDNIANRKGCEITMRELDNLCACCFSELREGNICQECGFDNDTPNDTMYLQTKTVLQGQYAIGAVKSHESDAVTYYGYDAQLDKPILIREFLPKGMANRFEGNTDLHVRQKFMQSFEKYKQDFYKLWTTMEKLHSLSASVPVYDVFECNSTVYSIIENSDCITLREYLVRNQDSYITWNNARLMFMPVLTTIESLHSNGIIHGSINPDSLLLYRDGKVRLAPFPISAACDASSEFVFTETEGYTALEQYSNNHKICNSTDIYGFSACIYRALVGSNPSGALARESNDKLMIPNSIAENIPMHVIKALVSGLQIYPEKRIKDVESFREMLNAAPTVQAKSVVHEDIYQEGATGGYPEYDSYTKSEKKRKNIVIALLVLLIIAVGASIYVVKYSGLINFEKESTTESVTQSFEVPNFTGNGYTQQDIQNSAAWNDQFRFTFQGEYSADAEEGTIFKQSIQPGEKVGQGTEIVLTVSKGIQTEKVPDVGSLNIDEAKKQLEELGFKVTTVEIYNDGSHQKNSVRANSGMAPAAGSVVAVGDEIVLQVYGEVQTTTTEPETKEQP